MHLDISEKKKDSYKLNYHFKQKIRSKEIIIKCKRFTQNKISKCIKANSINGKGEILLSYIFI